MQLRGPSGLEAASAAKTTTTTQPQQQQQQGTTTKRDGPEERKAAEAFSFACICAYIVGKQATQGSINIYCNMHWFTSNRVRSSRRPQYQSLLYTQPSASIENRINLRFFSISTLHIATASNGPGAWLIASVSTAYLAYIVFRGPKVCVYTYSLCKSGGIDYLLMSRTTRYI